MNMDRSTATPPPGASGGGKWLDYTLFAALVLCLIVFAAFGRLDEANMALATGLLLFEFWTRL
ncbi:hypothetical protein [Streptomyces griseus]|uniref:hypothetical protein n=1 Tax=Streptomyces griseus TaxID=1911 RepID=UPI00343C0CE7